MRSILYFDVSALPLFILILITVFARKLTKGNANRLFIALIILSASAAISDVIMEYCIRFTPISDFRFVVAQIFTHIYFITRNATMVTYFFFIFAITSTWYRVRSPRVKMLLLIPAGVMLVLILSNPFTHAVFTISKSDGYHRSEGIVVLYVISALYAFIGMIYLISCRRFLAAEKVVSLISLYVLSMVSVVVQFIFPFMLVEMLAAGISLMLVILFVLRPEEISDATVGALSYVAFKDELKKVLLTKQKVQLAVIDFTNSVELRSYLGEEEYFVYVSHIIKQLDLMFRRERIFFDIYFEHPGTIYIIIDVPGYNVEEAYHRLVGELRRSSEKMVSSGERITACACNIVIPDDLSDYDEILRFGHDFRSQMPQEQIFAKASDIISSRDYKIISNMDMILNRAISENKFRMYYQPIYSVDKGRFISAEALIRLIDDDFGFVSPGLFIPAAEKRGVILPIGDFVLEDVHRFISENDLAALGIEYIEVNLSVAQCMQEELPEKLAMLSDRYGVSPDRINLEITETTYEDMGSVMEFNLEALSGIGYTFSLDDYGTGYSNMQRVSKLPLKIIKLDKTLVDDMASDEGMSIVRNTVKMMRDIDKELVAEGVETKESLDELKGMGCHFIQGYYFSKPLPADEFITFIRQHNAG